LEYKFQDKNLYDKLRALVIKAFVLLQEKIKDGNKIEFTTIVEGGLVVHEDGKLSVFPEGRECRQKPDFSLFIFRYRDELEQLFEWKNVSEYISKNEIVRKQVRGEFVSPFGGFMVHEPNLLRGTINMCIDEECPFCFDLEIFNSVYDEIEKFFYSDSVTRKSFAPLLGFNSELEEICLGDGVKIRKIMKDEILDLWNNSPWFRPLVEGNRMSFSVHTPLLYVLELTVKAPKKAPNEKVNVPNATLVFNKVINTLRLFKKGWIMYPFTIAKNVSQLALGTFYGRSGSLPDIPMQLSYELTKDEVEDFKAFYKERGEKLNNLKIALTRFNETYRREGVAERKFEDVLIDCCIAFESLFCKDTQQKGEIIAIGASMLLGKDNIEREEINNYLRKLYQVRNDIVHASLPISDSLKKRKVDDDIGTFISKVEDYLRLCIKNLI
jgi:hypothetical protein